MSPPDVGLAWHGYVAKYRRGRASVDVLRAIQLGEMSRPSTCSECGSTARVCWHHDSYLAADTLKVRSLCRRCHGLWHGSNVATPLEGWSAALSAYLDANPADICAWKHAKLVVPPHRALKLIGHRRKRGTERWSEEDIKACSDAGLRMRFFYCAGMSYPKSGHLPWVLVSSIEERLKP